MGDKFEDTVRNLLRMKPKPHEDAAARKAEKERRPDEPGDASLVSDPKKSDD
ncbi:MAG: hypothetical protein ACQEUZ_12490 [Pseudomonadota bacterium]